jgi:hypothetical protein
MVLGNGFNVLVLACQITEQKYFTRLRYEDDFSEYLNSIS